MMEKAYKPQFYKALNYSQQRDIIPKRRREWAGERVSQLEKVKLYDHPEDYKDMMYSLAVPESNPIYPTFRAETGQWRHPSFDVLMRHEEELAPEEIANPQILILNFDGEDGETAYVEEINHLSPANNTNVAVDTDEAKFGRASLVLDPNGVPQCKLNYNLISGIDGDFTIHGWFRFASFLDWAGDYLELIYVWDSGDYFPTIAIYVTGSSPGASKIGVYIYDKGGNLLADLVETNPLVIDRWYHIAVVVCNSTITLYIDGIASTERTSSLSSPFAGIDFFQIDADSVTANGKYWADAIEITNYAKWTKDFTPPENPPARGVVTK